MNIVVVGWNDNTSTVKTVTDSAGNLYRLAIGPTSGSGLEQSIYYSPSITGGSNTVKVTFSQAANYPDVRVVEYQGVGSLDVAAGKSGNSSSTSSGAATTSSPNELIFASNTVATWFAKVGSGFTSRDLTTDSDLVEDEAGTTAGSYTASATLGQSGPWVMQMATFSAATGTTTSGSGSGSGSSGTTQPGLSALACSSGSMTGAGSDACTVSLTAAAPSGGMAVALSSSSSALTVPASVTVASGASSAAFTATATAVTTAQTATLTASSGGTTKTDAISLSPAAAALSLSSQSAAFGTVNLNTASTQSVTLTSSGGSAVTISAAKLSGSGFSMSGITAPLTLNPGATATLNVEFDPTTAGAATGTVTLTSNASNAATVTISLSGTGQAASYQVDLSWAAPSSSTDPVAGYKVYRATGSGTSYQLLNSSVEDLTSYTDSTVASGSSYTYYIESVDAAGNASAPSNTYAVTVP